MVVEHIGYPNEEYEGGNRSKEDPEGQLRWAFYAEKLRYPSEPGRGI